MSLRARSIDAHPRTVLITGGVPPQVTAVASALRETGARPVVVPDLAPGVGIGGLSFDAYLQFPIPVRNGTGEARPGEQDNARALSKRFQAATTVLPWLSLGARVVLVPAPPAESDTQLDAPARMALMRLIGQALRAEHAPRPLAVEICDHSCTARELAAATRRERAGQRIAPGEPADDTAAAYADWRAETLGLIRPMVGG